MMTIFRSFCQNRDQLPKQYLQVIYAILLFQLHIVFIKIRSLWSLLSYFVDNPHRRRIHRKLNMTLQEPRDLQCNTLQVSVT